MHMIGGLSSLRSQSQVHDTPVADAVSLPPSDAPDTDAVVKTPALRPPDRSQHAWCDKRRYVCTCIHLCKRWDTRNSQQASSMPFPETCRVRPGLVPALSMSGLLLFLIGPFPQTGLREIGEVERQRLQIRSRFAETTPGMNGNTTNAWYRPTP
jgi:hypothetical protein